ncbi:hypothetical protein DPMN_075047 [Dreissena polymorpha]|uniref:Uncharacterized protein n=1 Tax=Dreissena polymorpha TaxID=45954 RepID=A0A9D3YGC6_DREPO|nr:hypothetical protein DPMN_075047 [Dreissena polymorpha]
MPRDISWPDANEHPLYDVRLGTPLAYDTFKRFFVGAESLTSPSTDTFAIYRKTGVAPTPENTISNKGHATTYSK